MEKNTDFARKFLSPDPINQQKNGEIKNPISQSIKHHVSNLIHYSSFTCEKLMGILECLIKCIISIQEQFQLD
jgi:hypothetical protein